MPRRKADADTELEEDLDTADDDEEDTRVPRVHAIVKGFLQLLPRKPGDVWPDADLERFLQALKAALREIYKPAPPPA
jgi:hypothetical protein